MFNAMFIYENRTPDGTLKKLNDGKCQRNQPEIFTKMKKYTVFFFYTKITNEQEH